MKKNIVILATLAFALVGCESSRSDRDMNEPSGAEMKSDANQTDSSTNAPSTNTSPKESESPQTQQQ